MKTCPSCGAESEGRYCPQCGSDLEGGTCSRCQATLPPGARYCTRCGDAVGGRSGPFLKHLQWYVGGVAIIAVAAVLILPALFDSGGARSTPGASGAAAPFAGDGGTAGTPPALTGSPREQADRLFNRVMQASEEGDTAQVQFFVPMAIQAYDMAAPLDLDGVYHKAVLELAAGRLDEAQATAGRILEQVPDHLLALGVAARAAALTGNEAEAERLYRRLIDAYDEESRVERTEYVDHARILPIYRDEAEAQLSGSGS